MTALAQERASCPRYGAGGYPNQFFAPQKAATRIWLHALVVLNAGFAAPATEALNLVALGVAVKTYDNSAGADGAQEVVVDAGVFPFATGTAGDAITQADAGKDCYILDDQTVVKTDGTGTRSRAGKIVRVDSAGVWVLIGLGQ